MPKPIIAAIDPHREDFGSAALGLLLARATGAPLILGASFAVDPPVDHLYPEYARALRAETEQALERSRARIEDLARAQVAVTTTAIAFEDSPAWAMQELADRTRAELIVVGSSARGTLGRVLPGAVTDRVLHGAPCPVAVATAGFGADQVSAGLRLIGVAFVERADGRAALAHACELARAAGALVRILTVREPLQWLLTGPLDGAPLAAAERAREEACERTLHAGMGAVPEARSAGGEMLSGRPQDALAAASADFDLLICGSRGYGPVRTLLLGGVSHALVREAACPVLVVPLADHEPARGSTDPNGRVVAAG